MATLIALADLIEWRLSDQDAIGKIIYFISVDWALFILLTRMHKDNTFS